MIRVSVLEGMALNWDRGYKVFNSIQYSTYKSATILFFIRARVRQLSVTKIMKLLEWKEHDHTIRGEEIIFTLQEVQYFLVEIFCVTNIYMRKWKWEVLLFSRRRIFCLNSTGERSVVQPRESRRKSLDISPKFGPFHSSWLKLLKLWDAKT